MDFTAFIQSRRYTIEQANEALSKIQSGERKPAALEYGREGDHFWVRDIAVEQNLEEHELVAP